MDKDTKGQTVKRAANNKKRRYASPVMGCVSPFLVGVSKGGKAPFGTRLCLQSVVCYTLCRRWCENAVAGVGQGHLKQQENRAVFGAGQAANTGLVSAADRAYMNAPVHRPPSEVWDNLSRCCRLWSRWPEAGAAVLFSKIE